VEGYIVHGSKQVEIGEFVANVVLLWQGFEFTVVIFYSSCFSFTGTKLSEDCRKYGAENTCTTGTTLSKAALNFSRARAQIERERGNLLKTLGTQVNPTSYMTGRLYVSCSLLI